LVVLDELEWICANMTELLMILITFVVCRLKHTNIVQLLDVYEDKAFKYLVMELWVIIVFVIDVSVGYLCYFTESQLFAVLPYLLILGMLNYVILKIWASFTEIQIKFELHYLNCQHWHRRRWPLKVQNADWYSTFEFLR